MNSAYVTIIHKFMRPSGDIKTFIVFIKASRLFIQGTGFYEKKSSTKNEVYNW